MPNMNNNYEITGKYGPTFTIGHTQYVAEVSLDQFATMTIHMYRLRMDMETL